MGNHLCQIGKGSKIQCWGSNNSGQLGLGDSNDRGLTPSDLGSKLPYVDIGKNIIADSVCVGNGFSCAHTTDFGIKCWGSSTDGRLAQGDSLSRGDEKDEMGDLLPFIDFGLGNKATKVSCGGAFVCALFTNKKVKCWGSQFDGLLGFEGFDGGLGDEISELGDGMPFVSLGTSVEVDEIANHSTADHTCVILTTSQLMKCWGHNNQGELGYGLVGNVGKTADTMGNKLPTIDLGTVSKVKMITVGFGSTCALRVDDELRCWGNNNYGEAGIGTNQARVTDMGSSLMPTQYDAGKKIKQIAAAFGTMCVLFDDSLALKCIGNNADGQLGQGDTLDRGDELPTTIPNISAIDLGTGNLAIRFIFLGVSTTCVSFIDYRVKCFGSGSSGVLATGDTSNVGDGPNEMGAFLSFANIFATEAPTSVPTKAPTFSPTKAPTLDPTKNPTTNPSTTPTSKPTNAPIRAPTKAPATVPTKAPTKTPTSKSTNAPAAICTATRKKACKKDKICMWKKKTCSISPCKSYTNRPECIADILCDWKRGSCRIKPT